MKFRENWPSDSHTLLGDLQKLYRPCFWQIWVEFCVDDLHVMSLSSLHMILLEICTKRVIIYSRDETIFFSELSTFSWFRWNYVKVAPRCVITWLYMCHVHRCGKCLTSHRGAKVFLTTVSILIFNLGEIWYQSLFTVLGRIRALSWKATKGRSCLICGSKLNYIHTCVVKPHEILRHAVYNL